LANATFVVICLAVGFAAAWLSRSYRPLVGALSVPLAVFFAAVMAHVLYRPDPPLFNSDVPHDYMQKITGVSGPTLLAVSGLLLLGALGAVASMWLLKRTQQRQPG
jgi:hypothetical protein